MKKNIAMVVAIIFFLTPTLQVSAESDGSYSEEISISTMEQILTEYHSFLQSVGTENRGVYDATASYAGISMQTVNRLRMAGYEAYCVNEENFTDIEASLNTDLSDLGLSQEYTYVIIVSGEEARGNECSVNSSVGNQFTYTYNGTSYTMRYVTVTAADDPSFGKASFANLLTSRSQTLIYNCLNTAISAYISAVSGVLGTVASICGLDISDFNTDSESTLILNCGSNWTRVYTEVWSSYDNMWLACSCVENVVASSYMGGMYYDAEQNRYLAVPEAPKSITLYSEHYFDYEWRKQKAAIGYFYSSPQYDIIDKVEYKYGNETKIIHNR